MEEIKLSGPEFKALASETRAGIIKLLRGRNHTLTEMSKKLRLAAPTVKQHLSILKTADFIEELDEGRKWKYYGLTKKGKNIFLHQTPINVFIVLGISLFGLVGLLYSFISIVEEQTMSFAGIDAGQAFIESGERGFVLGAVDSAKVVAEQIVTGTVASGTAAPAAVNDGVASAVNAGTPFTFEMTVLLFGIVSVALLAGYLIAKTRN